MPRAPEFIASGDLARMAALGKAPKNPLVRVSATPVMKAINEAARSIDFCISDSTLDRDNDTIQAGGWDLTGFLKNPVVLWAHDPSQPPIARAPDTRVNANELISTAIFMPRDMSEFADSVFRMYVGGFMKATSVGFRPLDYELTSDSGGSGEWGCEFRSQELLEYSCVPVPANPNALMRAKAAGINTAPIRQWAEKLLDTGGYKLMSKADLEKLRKAAGSAPSVHHISQAKRDQLRQDNLIRVTLGTLYPNAKEGDAFVVGEDRARKWTLGKSGDWNPGPIGSNEQIAADGRVSVKGSSMAGENEHEGEEPKPLYVKRKVVNAHHVLKWMKDQGYTAAVHPDEMHVTVMHSKNAVDWSQMPHHEDAMTVPVHRGMPVEMGEHGAQVMHCDNSTLEEHHQEYTDAGCEHVNDEFKPHVTLTYEQHPEHPDHNVEAFSGELKLGPEEHHEVHDGFERPKHVNLEAWDGESNEMPEHKFEDDEGNTETYGQDPDEAVHGNPPKGATLAEILKLAGEQGRDVKIGADGSITILGKGEGAEWSCSAATSFSIDEEASWDGAAAKKAIFDACGFGADKPDTAKAAKHFLAHDKANPTLKGSYKLPFATIRDGKSVAIAAGIRNAASRLPQTGDLPDGVKSKARSVIDKYEERMGKAVTEADIRKIIREELSANQRSAPEGDGIRIKMDDGTYLEGAEALGEFIASSVDRAIKRAKGNIDAFV